MMHNLIVQIHFYIYRANRQPRFMDSLQAALYSLRFLLKNIIVTYEWYNAELKFGGCMMKYARTQYPDFMQTVLSYDNIMAFIRTAYMSLFGHVKEMFDENRQETIIERERIGSKIEQITSNDTAQILYANTQFVQPQNENYFQTNNQIISPSQNYLNSFEYESTKRRMDTFTKPSRNNHHFMKRSQRFSNADKGRSDHSEMQVNTHQLHELVKPLDVRNNINKRTDNTDADTVMYYGPRQFSSYQQTHPVYTPPQTQENTLELPTINDNDFQEPNNYKESINPDEIIDLESDNDEASATEEINTENDIAVDNNSGSSFFDFESVILERLGLKPKQFDGNTAARCTQNYILNALWRTIESSLRKI